MISSRSTLVQTAIAFASALATASQGAEVIRGNAQGPTLDKHKKSSGGGSRHGKPSMAERMDARFQAKHKVK